MIRGFATLSSINFLLDLCFVKRMRKYKILLFIIIYYVCNVNIYCLFLSGISWT